MPRELPILFKAPMVRAILDGTKTQTRRVMKLQPRGAADVGYYGRSIPFIRNPDPTGPNLVCPFGHAGYRLWVRESGLECLCSRLFIHDATPGRWWTPEDGGRYGASYGGGVTRESLMSTHRVRPSIHMPRWACRIVLEVTGVRVERLQDITDADALAEGVDRTNTSIAGYARERFQRLWAATGGDWDANPWVWVVDFKRVMP